ncbi:tumor necrosis factor ligand superfamily member 18 [Genypterus blacodes]|uniref:tumor necrosis factor ligand superfamily member 18 n=1 Tax=Genypterus blacodes TaxID=154954 RepID=UPI003F76F9B7
MHTLSSGNTHTHTYSASVNSRGNSGPKHSSRLSSCSRWAQAALKMPRPHEHRVIQVLLPLWVTLLTFSQVGLFIIFFTAQHHSQPENLRSGATYPTDQTSTNAPLLPPEKSKMLSFVAKEGNWSTIEWETSDLHSLPISAEKDYLAIKQDGYYFLCLQVTLKSHRDNESKVRIISPDKNTHKHYLEAQINENAMSTGILGKAEKLSAGTKLKVTIDPPANIDTADFATYLDVIFIDKP